MGHGDAFGVAGLMTLAVVAAPVAASTAAATASPRAVLVEIGGRAAERVQLVDTCRPAARRRGACPRSFPPPDSRLRFSVALAEGEPGVVRLPYRATRVSVDVLTRHHEDAVTGRGTNAVRQSRRGRRWRFVVPRFTPAAPNRLAVTATARSGTVRTYFAKVVPWPAPPPT